jgi:predicted phosphate transport protein (TIGR00153 family)
MAPSFTKLFGNSPFKALEDHSAKVYQCVGLIREVFDASLDGKRESVSKMAEEIFRLETEADEIRDQLHLDLTSRMLIPVSKDQLFNILEHQDSIADRAEDFAAIFTYRPLTLPDSLSKPVGAFLDESLANCKLAEGIFSKLIILVESSFSGRDALTISKLIFELRKREDATKTKKISLLQKVHQEQDAFDPVDLISWTQVIEIIGDISKFADNAATGISLVIRGK